MSDQPVAIITVKVWPNGALSVEGPITDKAWCVAALENAVDAVRNNGKPKGELIVPAKDVKIA